MEMERQTRLPWHAHKANAQQESVGPARRNFNVRLDAQIS